MRRFPALVAATLLACTGNGGGKLPNRVDSAGPEAETPVVRIERPFSAESLFADEDIDFSAIVSDAGDPVGTLALALSNSILGTLSLPNAVDADGRVTGTLRLVAGDQTLRLEAIDPQGNMGMDEISLVVQPANSPPTCAMSASGERGASIDSAAFFATADDVDEVPDHLTATWTSSLAGAFATLPVSADGTATIVTSRLPAGVQDVSVTVTDSRGASCNAAVAYTVGSAPTARVDLPVEGAVMSVGEAVAFAGVVEDVDDASEALAAVWTSDRDGVVGAATPDSAGRVGWTTAELSRGRHRISLTTVDTDGDSGSDAVWVVVNGLPTAPDIVLLPDPAGTEDALIVEVVNPASDPDGDVLATTFAWSVDGAATTLSVTDTLPASATSRGETWAVDVSASDGFGSGPSARASVVIGNTVPRLGSATISPTPVVRDMALTCVGVGYSDADGDSDQSTYSWSVDGVVVATASSMINIFSVGSVLSCQLTPYDGIGAGVSVSDTVVVENVAPEIIEVSLSPTSPATSDLVVAAATVTDAESDAVSILYTWTVNGVEVTESGASLDGAQFFGKGDSVAVSVVPSDEYSFGTRVYSTSLTVENTPPVPPVLSIFPSEPNAGDSLMCVLDIPASDVDGDVVVTSLFWQLNSVDFTGATTTDVEGDTIAGADVASGARFECAATPDDGESVGTSSFASVDVSTPDVTSLADVFGIANPTGDWSWGWAASPGHTDFHAFDAYADDAASLLAAWSDSAVGAQPSLTHHYGTVEATIDGVDWPAGGLALVPGGAGEVAALRYVLPADGACALSVTFAGLDCCTTTEVGVYLSGVSLGGGTIAAGGEIAGGDIAEFSVVAGDTLDFTVDADGDSAFDTTGVSGVLTCVY